MLAVSVQLISKILWKRKISSLIIFLISGSLFSVAGWFVWQRTAGQPDEKTGSEIVQYLPKLETFSIEHGKLLPTGNLKPFTQLWEVATVHEALGKPFVQNGVLLVGTFSATLDAFDIADGHRLWSLQKREPIFTPPKISGKQIFIGEGYHTSPMCELTSLALDGTPLWSRLFRSHLESPPMIDEEHNRLWYAGGATGLWALSMDTGEKIWWQRLGHMDVSPLYSDGRLFVVSKLKEDADGVAVFELNPDDGNIKWETALEGNTMGSILRNGEHIYLSTALGQVGRLALGDTGWSYSLSLDGAVNWKTKLPAMPLPEGALSPDGTLLFYTLKSGNIIALNTKDGSVVWQAKIGDEIQTDIALIEKKSALFVVAISRDGNVSIREAKTGNEYTHFTVEKGDSYPIYTNNILYIATPNTISAYSGLGG